MIHVVHLSAALDEVCNLFDGAFDGTGDLVNILRLHDSLQVILQNFGEVIYSS